MLVVPWRIGVSRHCVPGGEAVGWADEEVSAIAEERDGPARRQEKGEGVVDVEVLRRCFRARDTCSFRDGCAAQEGAASLCSSTHTWVMEVRRAVAADFEGYLKLFTDVASEGMWIGAEVPLDSERIRSAFDAALVDRAAAVIVADAESDIVGLIFLRSDDGVVGLGMMVAAGQRGKGLGRQLLDAGVSWARTIGAHKLALEVWPHNRHAIALYLDSGFEIEGRLRRHHRRRSGQLWDSVVMGKVLDTSSPGSPHRTDPALNAPHGIAE